MLFGIVLLFVGAFQRLGMFGREIGREREREAKR